MLVKHSKSSEIALGDEGWLHTQPISGWKILGTIQYGTQKGAFARSRKACVCPGEFWKALRARSEQGQRSSGFTWATVKN